MSDHLAAHLEFFEELGVAGVRREPAWRERATPDTPSSVGQGDPLDAAEDRAASAKEAGAPPPGPATAAASGGLASGGPASAGSVPGDASSALTALRVEIGPACTRCKLHQLGRKQVVFGVGNPAARLMFVGEAPGADEDIQGEPFVGKAGQLLTKIIEAIGMGRDQVYIANVIKCRPPGNRNPEPDEVAQCEPFLFRQIDAIRPKVIVALGKFAAQCLLRSDVPITRLRGREFPYRDAVLIPTFHPAYLLRNPSSKREVWEDMKRVRALLDE